jgi:phosphoglycerate dehydrogenase-like enzyme
MIEVVVTRPEYVKAEAEFRTAEGVACVPVPPEEAELSDVIRSRRLKHAIVGVTQYSGSLYEALGAGGVVARFGVGHDGIDKSRATARGILCTNTPGVLTESVAEHTMALLLAAARRIAKLAHSTASGKWEPRAGAELHGKTLAIIGCGAIGCRVAQMASFGFGMKVVGYARRSCDLSRMTAECGFSAICTDFAEAVADAGYVSLHIPGGPATFRFLDQGRLRLLSPKAWLINTARGGIVDESALFDALTAGRLAGAALDVTEIEPYRPIDPGRDLRTLRNLTITPHVGSNTGEANSRMARRAIHNIRMAEAGRFLEMDLLNPEVLDSENYEKQTSQGSS